MAETEKILGRNLKMVLDRIHRAALRAGRDPDTIRLVAVTKAVDLDMTRCLYELGVQDLGENRIQSAEPKIMKLQEPVWHLIGHLQSNKARRAVLHFPWIHGVDSGDLIDRLDSISSETGRRPRILIQVNVSGEPQKHGVDEKLVPEVLEKAEACENLEVAGLMTMAPQSDHPEKSRPYFHRLREMLLELRGQGIAGEGCRHLSMGMTGDFEVAVEEGATLVRVGRALFTGLDKADLRSGRID